MTRTQIYDNITSLIGECESAGLRATAVQLQSAAHLMEITSPLSAEEIHLQDTLCNQPVVYDQTSMKNLTTAQLVDLCNQPIYAQNL